MMPSIKSSYVLLFVTLVTAVSIFFILSHDLLMREPTAAESPCQPSKEHQRLQTAAQSQPCQPSKEHQRFQTNEETESFRQDENSNPFQEMFDDIGCVTEKSNESCTFPLLTDNHQRCGHFPASTSWENIDAGYPQAIVSADICKLAPVTTASQRLRQYIECRNITSIVTFGDSQGNRYNSALVQLFEEACFNCTLQKVEQTGFNDHLSYYTSGSDFTTNATIPRTCASCSSKLRVCSDKAGHRVELEYLSLIITSRRQLQLNNPACHHNQTKHPLCLATTLPEYVFQHYLSRQRNYPQLLLLFSGFAHDRNRPLKAIYNELQWIYSVITAHVPPSSSLIWYDAPSYHAKNTREWYTSEGNGYNPHQKMQAENRFLATLQNEHHRSGKSPPMFSFFGLYHMQEQLREAWAEDHVHSKPSWYRYVMGHTADMLLSLPVSHKVET